MRDLGHVLMKDYTTMQTGGMARVIVVEKKEELKEMLKWYYRRVFILGAGSNIIARDQGIKGVVLKNEIKHLRVKGNQIIAGSGVMMPELAFFALKNGLTGLEFMEGIPGTVGGGVYINAGFIHNMASVISSVTATSYQTTDFKTTHYYKEQCKFSFRKSIFQTLKSFITEAEFELKKGDPEVIAATMKKNHELRALRQPLQYASAGTIFRPDKKIKKYFGYTINRIQMVAPGFIINHGGGSSYDIIIMIHKIQREIGVKLEVEII